MVRIDILGPFEVHDGDGAEVRLPAGRARALLALLVIERGRVVSVDRILEALWGARPPSTAPKAVQGYVSQLRRALGESPILTRAPGYALRADALELDAARFEALAADGRRRLEDDDHGEAVRALEEALALWRGPALTDFAFEDFAQAELRRLEELRLSATEDRIEAVLGAGRVAGLPVELDALVDAHPLRERLRAQAMLALYRTGRQADALAVYREGRRRLADELGVEPGPELQRLQRAILTQDPSLEPHPAPARPAPPEGPEPPAPPPAARRRRPPPRRWIVAAVLAALLVAAGVLAAVLGARGTSPDAVAVAPPTVVAVDPRTDRVVATIDVGSRPLSLAVNADGLWVGDGRDGTVSRIDPTTRRVVRTIGIGAPAVDMAADDEGVWVATGGFGAVLRVDADTNAVVRRVEPGEDDDLVVPTISSVAVADGTVWAGALGGVVRIDARTGEVRDRIALGESPLALAADEDAVWASLLSRRVKRLDAVSGQETTEFYAGQLTQAVALADDATWLAAVDDGGVWKLDPVTGQTLLTARAGAGADAIAVGEGALWVGSWPDERLVGVDLATGEVEGSVPVGGEPLDVAVAGGLVWAAVPERAEPDAG